LAPAATLETRLNPQKEPIQELSPVPLFWLSGHGAANAAAAAGSAVHLDAGLHGGGILGRSSNGFNFKLVQGKILITFIFSCS